MKKVIVLAATLVLTLSMIGFAVLSLWDQKGVESSGSKPWPVGGTLESAARRYPALQPSPASIRLLKLGSALPRSGAVDDYVTSEIRNGRLAIAEPPPLPDVAEIRELLLSEPVVWERRRGVAEVGDSATSDRRGVQMTIARALVADALARARTNDGVAWLDLQAAWMLAESLDSQPQMMSRTAALSMTRFVNAVAWKMPPPLPRWFERLQERDFIEPLLESFQYQSASYWMDGSLFPTSMLAQAAEHDRQIAELVARQTNCDVAIAANKLGVDLSSVWRRAFRYRAEREATANAIRIRNGEAVSRRSQCADGSWTFADGTIRFSKEIPTFDSDPAMPLSFRVMP